MGFKKYSKTEPIIFTWFMLPFVAGLNLIVLGNCTYAGTGAFFSHFAYTALYIFFIYFIFRTTAILVRRRFPSNADLFRRIAFMIPIFSLLNVLMVTGLYAYYKALPFATCTPVRNNFWWAVFFAVLTSTILILVNEAVVNFQGWKKSVTETEQLKNAYQKTRLLGLKGQVNPHFLFNCFNSLSSLISEDEAAAEKFLNEMTRVHRYMLRGDDEMLVTVEEELRFIQSYLHLINARFGTSVDTGIDVSDQSRSMYIPPLSIHVILENTIYSNSTGSESPLRIRITDLPGFYLRISNNIQPRIRRDHVDQEEGIDNLLKKYQLMNQPEVEIRETESERVILLPLISEKEELI